MPKNLHSLEKMRTKSKKFTKSTRFYKKMSKIRKKLLVLPVMRAKEENNIEKKKGVFRKEKFKKNPLFD